MKADNPYNIVRVDEQYRTLWKILWLGKLEHKSDDDKFEVERYVDGTIKIKLPHNYIYGGDQPEKLVEALQLAINEDDKVKANNKIRHQKACVNHLKVVPYPEDDEKIKDIIKSGKAVEFFASYSGLKESMSKRFPSADIYYTERNGDGIGLLVPNGTSADQLPDFACGYHVFEWIDPDKEFGTGIQPIYQVSIEPL